MHVDWTSVKQVLDILVAIVVLLGVPSGLYQFRRSVKKEQRDREYATYDALDQKYIEFQSFCFDHPRLDISDIPNKIPYDLTVEEQKQELIAFDILFSLFERAFLMFDDKSTEMREKQWSGWEEYIRKYCKRENVRHAWSICGTTFDSDFREYMKKFIS